MSDSSDDVRWLTYQELADLRGIAAASAKRQAFRRRWRCQLDDDGTTRVGVPLTLLTSPRDRSDGRSDCSQNEMPRDREFADLRERIAGLGAANAALSAAHKAEIDRLVAEHEIERARIGQDHVAELERMSAAHEAEIKRLIAAHATELVRIDRIATQREDERTQLSHAHAAELERLIAAHEAEIERLTAVHAAELRGVRQPESTELNPVRRGQTPGPANPDQAKPAGWKRLLRRQ